MKLTNGEIYNTKEPLTKLMNSEKFPLSVSLGFVKLAHILSDQIKIVDEVRNKLVKDYGKPMKGNPGNFSVDAVIEKKDENGESILDDKGNIIMEANPDFPLFAADLNALFAEEVELEFDPIKLPAKVASTCDKCHHNMDKEFQVEPAVLLALEKFVTVA